MTSVDGDVRLSVGFDTKGINKGINTTEKAIGGLQGKMGKLAGALGLAFSVTAMIKMGKDASMVAMQTEASVQRVVDIFGTASNELGSFIDKNADLLGLSKGAAAKYAAVYGNLFSVWADQSTNANLTQQYLQTTAVVASKTGRTMADVQERIRSGLLGNTEAIEDLGIFVNIKTIEMTQAFKDVADGRTWEQLGAYEQQQVRTLAILEQATSKYGNSVANNANFAMQQASAATQNLQNTLGQLLNVVIVPAINLFTSFTRAVNELLIALFGLSSNIIPQQMAQVGAIGGAVDNQKDLTNEVKNTAKAQKNVLAGFDDIEVLSKPEEPTSVGGGGANVSSGGGGANIPMVPDTKPEESKIGKFAEKIKQLLEPAIEALGRLKLAFDPFKENMADGLVWLLLNVLILLGTFVITEAVPAFIDVLAGAIGVLNTILETFKPLGIWLWETFLKPFLAWAGEKFIEWLEALTEDLGKVSEWMKNNQSLMETIIILIGSFALAWGLVTLAMGIWNVCGAIATAVTTALGAAVAFLTSPVGLVVLAIGALIAIIVLLVKNWDSVKKAAEKAWKLITELWGKFATWFSEKVWKPFTDGLKAVANFFIGIINGMISAFEGFVNFLLLGVNSIINALNSIKIDIPDWVPGVGGSTFGFAIPNVPNVSFGRIPMLAQGAVIPPNKKFLAVLGDQKNGTNIETPLDTMVMAFKAALSSDGNSASSSTTVILEIDGREFGRAVVETGKNETKRVGTKIILV